MIASEQNKIGRDALARPDWGSIFFFSGFLLIFGACLYLLIVTYGFGWLEIIQPGAGNLAYGYGAEEGLRPDFWAYFILKIVLMVVCILNIVVGVLLALTLWRLRRERLTDLHRLKSLTNR